MHYQIFFPHETVYTPELLKRAGLGELLRAGDREPTCFPLIGAGPDQQNTGIILDWGASRPGYFPTEQTWRRLNEQCWFGINNASPPTPGDLLRPEELLIDGTVKVLGDGHEWILPNIAYLPCRFGLGDDGRPERKPDARFEEFQALAIELFDRLAREQRERDYFLPEQDKLAYAARVLAVNFRVALPICLALELFADRNLDVVLSRAVDRDKLLAIYVDVQKKKVDREEESSIPPG